MSRRLRRFLGHESGAIAPLYALALFGLVGMAGVGFDYGRMMALDTELQNAADQAALAAATQMSGQDDAITDARNAIRDFFAADNGPFTNITSMANDGEGRDIVDLTIEFYADYANDDFPANSLITTCTMTGACDATEDDDRRARVVRVRVNAREAFFALTPVVDAISSGGMEATAVAGLESAVCRVPPLMFCVPEGDTAFPGPADVGRGLKMHIRANESADWAPGNFGFLDIDYPNVAPSDGNHLTGLNTDFLGCAGGEVESRTGSRTPELRALNTRFDIHFNNSTYGCDTSNGDFCPSQNARKNWVVVQQIPNNNTIHPSLLTCNSTPPSSPNWIDTATTSGADDPAMEEGYPKDSCFSSSCSIPNIGNAPASWNGAGYMSAAHPSTLLSDVPDLDGNGARSRYEVYQWEVGDVPANVPQVAKVGYDITSTSGGRIRGNLYCAYSRPATPVTPSSTQKDRRVISVAAVDCSELSGHDEVTILRWVDLFLVQPSDEGGADKSFFAEVIGPADPPDGSDGFQNFGRHRAVLIR